MITTRLYLDTRRNPDQGTQAPLKLSIYHGRSESFLSTGIKLAPSQWDAKKREAKDKTTQLAISRFKLKVDILLADLQEAGKLDGLNASDIRKIVEREISPDSRKKDKLLDYMERFAQTRRKKRTTEIYMATVDRILAFDSDARRLRFEDIDFEWLEHFNAFLARTSKKKNARNVHFRNIRAVFKDAMRKRLTMSYPLDGFDIRPERTKKRNLTAEQLRKLFSAELPEWQRKYVDFFKISFMLIGMNTEDLVHADSITGGRLDYSRAKTYCPYSIKVEEECQEIIERYPGQRYLLDVLDHYASTHNWTSRIDRSLKTIAARLGLPPFSMLSARHSWATIAADLDIPKETIAAAMGHSSNTVTDIYINFDRGKIDRANRQVIDYVLYDRKPVTMYDLMRQINEIRNQETRTA